MLALSRKKGESIIIGDDIELVVIDVTKDGVRLGIKAPRDVSIYRKEIFEQIKKENEGSVLNTDIMEIKKMFKK